MLFDESVTPYGLKNDALVPVPSVKPKVLFREPASVETSPATPQGDEGD